MESEIELGSWDLTAERVKQYLEAVGDDPELYFQIGLVPPLALSAYALGALLEKLALPAGAIHSLQEIDSLLPVSLGQHITGRALVERPRRRGSLQFMTVAYTLTNAEGVTVQTGKTTVLVAAGASP